MRDADSLIPVEVKAMDGAIISLNELIESDKYSDIKYRIKLGYIKISVSTVDSIHYRISHVPTETMFEGDRQRLSARSS